MSKFVNFIKDIRVVVTVVIGIGTGLNAYILREKQQWSAGVVSKDYFDEAMANRDTAITNMVLMANIQSSKQMMRELRDYGRMLVDTAAYPYLERLGFMEVKLDGLQRDHFRFEKQLPLLKEPTKAERLMYAQMDTLARQRDEAIRYQRLMAEMADLKRQVSKIEFKPKGDQIK